jgi:hypothetical protein
MLPLHPARGLTFIVALLLCQPAFAQEPAPSAGLQLGAGVTLPVGGAWSASGIGWDVSVAGDLEIGRGLGVRADYTYGRFAADELQVRGLTLSSQPPRFGTLGAKTQAHFGSLDLLWRKWLPDGRGSFYAFGGPAVALRRVTITSVRADGGAPFNDVGVEVCEPLWLECAGPRPYHEVLGIRRSTDLGLNVGGGFSLDVGLNAHIFAEGRFVFLDGPSFRGASGTSRSANAMYVPFVAGIRFQLR